MNTSTARTYLSSRLRGAVEAEDRGGERWLNEAASVSAINRLYGFLGPPLLRAGRIPPSAWLYQREHTRFILGEHQDILVSAPHTPYTPHTSLELGYFHIAERITAPPPPPPFLPTQDESSHPSFFIPRRSPLFLSFPLSCQLPLLLLRL